MSSFGLPRWRQWEASGSCQSRRQKRCGFDPQVGKIPWRRAWQPTPVYLPGEPHGQRSLAGCNVRSLKESDTHVIFLILNNKIVHQISVALSYVAFLKPQKNTRKQLKVHHSLQRTYLFFPLVKSEQECLSGKIESGMRRGLVRDGKIQTPLVSHTHTKQSIKPGNTKVLQHLEAI